MGAAASGRVAIGLPRSETFWSQMPPALLQGSCRESVAPIGSGAAGGVSL